MTKLESEYLLPVARSFHTFTACLALLVAILAIVAAIYFHSQTDNAPMLEAVPEPYTPRSDVAVETTMVERYLSPPSGIGFVVSRGYISSEISSGELLGYFAVESFNPVPDYPDDIVIIDGETGLFERIQDPGTGRTGLAATDELANLINEHIQSGQPEASRSISLSAIAYDIYRNRSEPIELDLLLTFGPSRAAAADNNTPPQVQLSPMEAVARDISTHIDPNGTTLQFDTYSRALAIPSECNASGMAPFAAFFRNAFETTKERLTPTNVEAFYLGVCAAWASAVAQEQARANEVAAQIAATRNLNEQRAQEAELSNLTAVGGRTIALYIIAVTFGVFLMIAMVMAFFAIEGHAMAIRKSVERYVDTRCTDTAREN